MSQQAEGAVREHVPAPPAEEIFAGYDILDFDYLKLVPKTMEANLKYRKALLEQAAESKAFQDALYLKCKDDILFWVNAFCWLIEPRTTEVFPFITYPFQDKAILKINDAVGNYDVVIVKSRDQGGTWMVVSVFTYRWQFFGHSEFQLTSRIEDDVDTQGDYSSLLPKVDFLLEHQPKWLAPPKGACSRKHLNLRNEANESLFRGYATSPNAGRSGRRLGTLFDEFAAVEEPTASQTLASTQHIGPRIWCSTPIGPSGAFASVAYDKNIQRIDLDWSEHPEKNPGLYTSERGKLIHLDPRSSDFKANSNRVKFYEAIDGTVKPWPQAQRGFPPDYKFVVDGKRRSPYYDYECLRSPVAQFIAQELDRDFLRSGSQFFEEDVLGKIRQKCRVPEFIGEFQYDPKTGELLRDDHNKVIDPRVRVANGHLRLWSNLREPFIDPDNLDARDLSVPPRDITAGDVPADGAYIVGADVSAGSGQSNSTLVIIDAHTAEQVGLYENPHVQPHEHAVTAKAVATWLNNAVVIWDGQGPTGSQFRTAFLDLGYTNYWRRRAEDRIDKKIKREYPGWIGNTNEKAAVLNKIRMSLAQETLRIYAAEIVNEASEYVNTVEGKIVHSSTRGAKEPGKAEKAHGDSLMALAMAWWACPDIGVFRSADSHEALPGSLAWRRELAEKAKKANTQRHRRPRRVNYA